MSFGDMNNGEMVSRSYSCEISILTNQKQFAAMDFTNPLTSDNVLQDFDFDSFLHDGDGDPGAFDFNPASFGMEAPGEIGAD
jgi:hypothetical protein